jgi:hypothetical protein
MDVARINGCCPSAEDRGTHHSMVKGNNTGIAFYTGINDFYKPLRDFLHPLYASLRLFTPLYKSPFCKTTTQISDYIDLVLALSRSRSSY